jgi:quercetin dioxygenase-like cupin family protein
MGVSGIQVLRVAVLICAGSGVTTAALAQAQGGPDHAAAKERGRIVFSHALPKMDGDRLEATVVEVNYGPGESSAPHSHPCAVIGYVITGSIRTQVKGEPERVVKPGESFYEAPNGVHLISANASSTEPAKLLAYLICDHDAPLSIPQPEAGNSGGK